MFTKLFVSSWGLSINDVYKNKGSGGLIIFLTSRLLNRQKGRRAKNDLVDVIYVWPLDVKIISLLGYHQAK